MPTLGRPLLPVDVPVLVDIPLPVEICGTPPMMPTVGVPPDANRRPTMPPDRRRLRGISPPFLVNRDATEAIAPIADAAVLTPLAAPDPPPLCVVTLLNSDDLPPVPLFVLRPVEPGMSEILTSGTWPPYGT